MIVSCPLPRLTSPIVSEQTSETRIPVSTIRSSRATFRSGAGERRAVSRSVCTCCGSERLDLIRGHARSLHPCHWGLGDQPFLGAEATERLQDAEVRAHGRGACFPFGGGLVAPISAVGTGLPGVGEEGTAPGTVDRIQHERRLLDVFEPSAEALDRATSLPEGAFAPGLRVPMFEPEVPRAADLDRLGGWVASGNRTSAAGRGDTIGKRRSSGRSRSLRGRGSRSAPGLRSRSLLRVRSRSIASRASSCHGCRGAGSTGIRVNSCLKRETAQGRKRPTRDSNPRRTP
jgi:hypothetical protein